MLGSVAVGRSEQNHNNPSADPEAQAESHGFSSGRANQKPS
jgi:hypothetical protein